MNNKFTMLLLAFFAGAVIGAAIIWMLCNCSCCQKSSQTPPVPPEPPDFPAHTISVQQANTYFHTYLNTPVSVDTLKAFTINSQQFDAMKAIAAMDTTVHGFRIYMGMDSLTPVRMVVGTGTPDHTDNIYVTSDVDSGPCPWVCDDTSPISQ
ncbi:MAG: hypothetical protein WCJ26_10675 [bacterium]